MAADDVGHQLPGGMVAREFGEVNVRRRDALVEVRFTVLMEPEGDLAEGWQTGVALDASASMKGCFGLGLCGRLPPPVESHYRKRGWLDLVSLDGRAVMRYLPEASEDALRRGYLARSPNVVEPLARRFVAYLADNLDEDGGPTVLHWGCEEGDGFEVLGAFTAAQARDLSFGGPRHKGFGTGTRLLPALRYLAERFRLARRGMYLFLTDGRIGDLGAVKRYTRQLGEEIVAGRRNAIRCVLIGVGDQTDERQMEELAGLETGTSVDVWDYKIANQMRDVAEIFAGVVNENTIVAPAARILDADGRLVRRFTDGMPARVSFTMSASSPWFELEVGGQRVRQPVVTQA